MKEAKALSVAWAESILWPGYHWLGGHELVGRKWRLNRVEYLITCIVSNSSR